MLTFISKKELVNLVEELVSVRVAKTCATHCNLVWSTECELRDKIKRIGDEEFIDNVVDRIRKKQL